MKAETVQFQRRAVAMPYDTMNGRTIRRLRTEAGMKQKHLAEAMGISASYLCDFEHGKRGMDEEKIGRAHV